MLTTTIFPPAIGGPATFVNGLAHALAGAGDEVTVVCVTPAADPGDDRDLPFRVIRVPSSSPLRFHAGVRRIVLSQVGRHHRILANGLEEHVATASRLLRRSFVLKVVGDSVWERARNQGATSLSIDDFQRDQVSVIAFRGALDARRRILESAHAVVTPSRYLAGVVREWGVGDDKVRVIPNGVELDASLPAATRVAKDRLRVLFVGRLTNWKGVDTLLTAVSTLPNVAVTIIGDGPELPALTALARLLKVNDRVEFTGPATPAQVREALGRANALVLDSLYEGMSHTLLEAMAAGVPCIASRCGGNGEVVVDGESGLLVPVADVDALRGALERLERDDAGRLALARGAKERATSFDIARTVDLYAALLAGG